ncbi:DUF7059 domain-containing protein [Compostimonas suwonensis]|uniref:Methyltransferase family protein n=1 Tax=Compostimonas suwonensis TaxID=1048394 RepID=A0A2M9BZQ1_9MICO|nr:methyltransferase [Compostimonas suwonensis]PJJ63552.1 methyltransferase family protein [Compostimonas suwonensis]
MFETDGVRIGALRRDLEAARFSVERLTQLWGEPAQAALAREQRVPAVRALSLRRDPAAGDEVPDPAGTLALLFILGLPCPAAELAAALPETGIDGALALGLVERDGENVTALVDLRPYSFVDPYGVGSWWIVSDLGELALGRALGEQHVLGVGGASLTLSGLMIGRRVGSVLDLGTGCGIQAMHASRHAQRVVATDISSRALGMARFNALLNGIDTIEFRLGSLFEPVAGERFDHIVSNPPFVITPRTKGVPEYEYRDGGMVGDALVARVIRESAQHLTPGGVAQLLGNWEYSAEGEGLERVEAWLAGTGLDAWVVEREVHDAQRYAETWIRDGGTRARTPEFDRLYDAWLDDFERRRVRAVGFGYVMLRRPTSGEPSLSRLEHLDGAIGSNESGLGEHLERFLDVHDWQHALDDAELEASTLLVAPDVTEERHYWPGAEDPTVLSLHQGGGFGRTVRIDTGLAALVGACDGELAVGAIIAAIAQLLDVSHSELREELLPRVRELLVTGFLQPAEL